MKINILSRWLFLAITLAATFLVVGLKINALRCWAIPQNKRVIFREMTRAKLAVETEKVEGLVEPIPFGVFWNDAEFTKETARSSGIFNRPVQICTAEVIWNGGEILEVKFRPIWRGLILVGSASAIRENWYWLAPLWLLSIILLVAFAAGFLIFAIKNHPACP